MALVTFQELLDLVVMILAIGFIFKDSLNVAGVKNHEPLDYLKKKSFFGSGFKNGLIVAAPAIVLHEAAHKIAALSFGFEATFHAAYVWLGIGVVLKLLSFPFLFFIPGYVTYSAGSIEPLTRALIAFAGPLANLVLFLFAAVALRQNWLKNHVSLLVLTKQINLFLFVFNMLPLGFFDGAHVFGSLASYFFG